MDRTDEANLTALARQLCLEHLPAGVVPKIRWGTARKAMGLARFGVICYRDPRLTFSRPLFAATTPEERVETVHHEVAHLVVFYELLAIAGPASWSSFLKRDGAHGPRWRTVMARFGYPHAKACHEVHLPRVPRAGDVSMSCACPAGGTAAGGARGTRTYVVGLQRAARGVLSCRICHRRLTADPVTTLAIDLVRAAHGAPTALSEGLVRKAAIVRGWPAASVLRLAREVLGVPRLGDLPTLPVNTTGTGNV